MIDAPPLPLVGPGPVMRALAARAGELARDVTRPVLVVGPRGIGKQLLAQRIHAASSLARRGLVTITGEAGTEASVRAALDAAGPGGVVLVRRVERLPLAAQVVLDERARDLRGPARLLATSADDIIALVTAGQFSEALYYRLHAWPLLLPALADRDRDDLLTLCTAVLTQTADGDVTLPVTLDTSAAAAVLAHAWPDNLRELEAVLALAQLRSRGAGAIVAAALPMAASDDAPPPPDASMQAVEDWHLQRALAHHGGNRTHTARALGISRMTLISKLRPGGDDAPLPPATEPPLSAEPE